MSGPQAQTIPEGVSVKRFPLWFAISIASGSCSSSAKPEPPSGPQVPITAATTSPGDAAEAVATPDAASAKAIDDKHPRIFPWAMWRQRNEKWLATPSDNHCDPRNDHVRRKGEAECYPPSNVQLAVIVTNARITNNDTKMVLTVDRGFDASVKSDYYFSVLDADDRPSTRWVHPTYVDDDSSRFELPVRIPVPIERGVTHAAIVQQLTSDDRFPDDDPRSQP